MSDNKYKAEKRKTEHKSYSIPNLLQAIKTVFLKIYM